MNTYLVVRQDMSSAPCYECSGGGNQDCYRVDAQTGDKALELAANLIDLDEWDIAPAYLYAVKVGKSRRRVERAAFLSTSEAVGVAEAAKTVQPPERKEPRRPVSPLMKAVTDAYLDSAVKGLFGVSVIYDKKTPDGYWGIATDKKAAE